MRGAVLLPPAVTGGALPPGGACRARAGARRRADEPAPFREREARRVRFRLLARAVVVAALLAFVVGCGGRPAPSTIPRYVPGQKYEEVGVASWYGKQYHGRKTASGETFKMNGMTAAHRTLPLGITAKVTNLENGRSVKVRINDRGPFVEGRILDLSYGAAKKLDMVRAGLVRVRIEIKR